MSDLPAVIALGVSSGLQAALLALGLVLIYRANRFINFAQGQLGSIASAGLAVLIFRFHAPYAVALPAALVAGVGGAAVVERLLGWRLFDKSRLVLLVATIGVAQLILLLVLAGPLKVDPGTLAVRGYPQPFHLRWTVGSAVLNSSQVLTVIVAPIIAVGLYLFLARTKTGRAIRGASSNPDAARLAGISVRRISLTVWMIAGLVSSLAAILYAPSQPAIGFGDSGPGLLLRGLAAALLARMFDFRIAVAAAVVLGIIEQATVFYTHVAGLTDLVLAVSLAAGLLLRARALAGDIRRDEGLVVERSAPSLPARMRAAWAVHNAGRLGWLALFAVIAFAPLLPGLGTQERAVFLVLMIAFAMTGMALTVLTGWGGQVSLGQFAFVGVGAYVATRAAGLGVPAMLLVCGLVTAATSVLVGAVAVRFRGLFLGVVTLAFAFAARSWLFRQGVFVHDASAIVRVNRPFVFGLRIETVRAVYAIGVVTLALTALSLHSLRRSSIGRAIIAGRDNDELAAAHGISPRTSKLIGLAVAGFVTGVAGGLWGMGIGTWSFAAFDPSMSFVLLSAAIVGGIGTLYGPILGVIAVFAWPYLVPRANTIAVRSFTSGILLLVTLLFFPGGIASLIQKLRFWLIDATTLVRSGLRPPLTPAGTPEGPHPPAIPSATAVGESPGTSRPVAPAHARALEAADVSISFGGIQALDRASLHVEAGEIVGLIGGNGAGKSTLLGCISGHIRPDAGTVTVSGTEVTNLAPERRSALGVRRTFQDARLFPGLTLTETVAVAADHSEPAGVVGAMTASPWLRRSERLKADRARAVLAEFGLADRANGLTGELSTGMRRVCDLAAVAAAEPTIVLLDEPTAGLAQREVEAFAPLLRAMRDRYGASVLLVEHDVPLMMTLCDRIYCLESGQVIAEGTPDEIRANPRVIASYLGTDPTATAAPAAPAPAQAESESVLMAGIQVRRWYDAANRTERATTALVIAAAAALLITSVALTPPTHLAATGDAGVAGGPTSGNGTLTPSENGGGVTPGATGQGSGPAGTARTNAAGGGGSAGGGAATAGKTGSGVVRTASDRGVAPTKIKIGFLLSNTAGLNGAGFSTGQRQDGPQYIDALAKWASKNGGVAGREVVPAVRYTDPTSVEDQAAACRAMVDDNKVFGLVDVAAILDTAALDCIVRPDTGNTPFVHSALWSSDWQKRSGGNEVSYQAAVDRISITSARDLAAMKWFPPGATIGILGDKCPATEPVILNVLGPALKAKGAGKIVVGAHDCDIQSVVSQPPNIVTQFRLAGVTHVLITSNFVTGQLFTSAASSQGYHPKYSTSDWFLNTSNVTTANFDPSEFDGAIGITSMGTVLKASGKKPYDGWQTCSQIATDAGMPGIAPGDASSEELLDLCDNFRLMIDAINAAGPNPTRAAWRNVIPTLPPRVSAQFGPSRFTPSKLSGSDYVHTLQWQAACRCYRSISDFRPAAA